MLGKWLDERALAGKHGPCPMCGGEDRFRFDNRDGAGTWICSHCGAGDGFHLLQQVNGWGFAEAARYVEQQAGKIEAKATRPSRSVDEVRERLRVAWGSAQPIAKGDVAWTYLERRCGIVEAPRALRFAPSLAYYDDGAVTHYPAMLAQVVDNSGAPITVHRTYLTQDGLKAPVASPRKLMTPAAKMDSAVIRLARVSDWMGVAEGIETALCASLRYSIPVWSCVTAGMLVKFRPPPEVKLLVIFGDHDESYTGQAAAYELARAVTNTGTQCRVMIPEVVGDWADEYIRTKDAIA